MDDADQKRIHLFSMLYIWLSKNFLMNFCLFKWGFEVDQDVFNRVVISE